MLYQLSYTHHAVHPADGASRSIPGPRGCSYAHPSRGVGRRYFCSSARAAPEATTSAAIAFAVAESGPGWATSSAAR